MRILYVISGLGGGGAEHQLIVTARALAARGHRVLVYALNGLIPRASALEGSGVGLVVDRKRARLDPAVLRRLRRTIREWRAEIVHGMLYDGNVYAALAGWGNGVRVVASELSSGDGLSRLQKAGYLLTRRCYRALFANSETGLERLASLLEPELRRCIVNGIDLDEIDRRTAAARAHGIYDLPWTDAPGVRTFVVVGALAPVKDQMLALRVLEELDRRSPGRWRALFVGDARPSAASAAYRDELVGRARARFPAGQVAFTGFRSDAVELIACSDLLLSSSVREGFPNVVLEAMAAGTPVVSTDYTDIRRILPFEWQVPPGRDPAQLASAMETALAEAPAVRAAQRAWVAAHATVERMADGFESLYADVVGAREARLA